MKIPRTAHSGQPWRIHEFTGGFRTEDVWSFRTPGAGPDDFPVMLAAMQTAGGFVKQPRAVRFLFAVRWKLGAVLGWDKPKTSLGKRVQPLYDRLPGDLRETVDVTDTSGAPFTPVYLLHNESVRELANKTCHAVMHLGWVPTGGGEYELRMAILVKPNGRFGRVYMALIAPFRYLIVYPAITRQWERAWRDRELPLHPKGASVLDRSRCDRRTPIRVASQRRDPPDGPRQHPTGTMPGRREARTAPWVRGRGDLHRLWGVRTCFDNARPKCETLIDSLRVASNRIAQRCEMAQRLK